MAPENPVVIIGAGIVGLTLAHGLKQAGIPFQVFERDESAELRSQGWAVTLHWALPFLREMLDPDTLAAVDAVQVDADVARHDSGNFLFLNLETLEAKFRIPPAERRRLDRNKLRNVLVEGIADRIHWGKRLVDVQVAGQVAGVGHQPSVTALFADGTRATGRLLVGADGTNSATRRFLVPNDHQNYELPVHMLGTAVRMTPVQARPLRDIDPLLFQGCHPQTGVFLWISTLSTPETNGSLGTGDEHYMVQIAMSWKAGEENKGGISSAPPSPAASTTSNTSNAGNASNASTTDNAELVALMQRLAAGFHPVLRAAIEAIPPSHGVSRIALRDWPSRPWDNRGGLVTLVGDAAHAMTMYRGEACNHGILDARNLLRGLRETDLRDEGSRARKDVLDVYEEEMQERGAWAVLLSREACLGAHDFHGLNEDSAVLRRRTFTA